MSPVEFIPVAEQSDLIVRLGSHVLLRAAHEAARWQRELPREERPLFVSVNISSRQIFRQNLIQEIRHILGRNIVPKGSLRLEVTESLVMENPEQATEILEWLRGAGAELALDDFGTGYSSLAYLQRFPFDTIKVDRALVQAHGESGGAGSAIVRSIVALAHELGKSVVAEGVENAEDVAFLRSINCQYAQGFYYGEPMSDRDVLQLLKMVRTAENKLRPRGLFRAKTKGKQRGKKTNDADVMPEEAEQAEFVPQQAIMQQASLQPPLPPQPAAIPNGAANGAGGRARPSPGSVLGRMTRTSPANGGGLPPPPPHAGPPGPPPVQHGHHGNGAGGDFEHSPMGMPPPVHAERPAAFNAPPTFDFEPPPPPDGASAPPPLHFDQFSPPPVDHPAGQFEHAPQMHSPPPVTNGGPQFDHFGQPPMMPDNNPLVAAMTDEPMPGAPMHQPDMHLQQMHAAPMMPPPGPQAPQSHLGARAPQAAHQPAPSTPNGAKPVPQKPKPDFSGLPPAMAESLAKLAGVPWPPPGEGG